MAKILVLEDERTIADTLKTGLSLQQHTVEVVSDGEDALDRLKHYHFDLAILDWSVPKLQGSDVCKQYRDSGGKIPIIMLTGKHEIDCKEEAFEIGADDYLTKPFSFRELVARIKALLRRPAEIAKNEFCVGNVSMDMEKRAVTIGGIVVELKAAEFALLELFMRSPGRLFSAGELVSKLYSSEAEVTDEAVRQRIFRLRKLLTGATASVQTQAGQGWRLTGVETSPGA